MAVGAAGRLAKVEATLSPTELVLRWLDEAHAFGSLEAYVAAQLAESPLTTPLDRLAREAAAGARASIRGKGAAAVEVGVRTALREAVFRFELVMRINVTVHERIERERLVAGLLSAHLALLASERDPDARTGTPYLERLARCRDLAEAAVRDLCATQEAREGVERRELAGHPALFPDEVTAWNEQLATSRSIADLASRLADHDGIPAPDPPEANAVAELVTRYATDLVEPAKATALDKLGEGERALRVAAAWVRARISEVPYALG